MFNGLFLILATLFATSCFAGSELSFSPDRQAAVRLRDGGAVEYQDVTKGDNHVLLVDPEIQSVRIDKDGNLVLVKETTYEVFDPRTGVTLSENPIHSGGSASSVVKKAKLGSKHVQVQAID